MDSKQYDLVILGSGSTAFAAALRAQELGKSAVMTEERTVGGTCVNRGCLPSKNLIEAARLVHDARGPRYPGLAGSSLAVDFGTLVRQKDEVVREYRDRKYSSLLGGNIGVIEGHAEFVDGNTVQLGGTRLTGEAILIATGSRPVVPAIEGLDQTPYLTSDLLTSEEQELTERPGSLLIVGAGYIALELGQMFHRLGTRVTMVARGERPLARGYEPELGRVVAKLLAAEGIQLLTNSQVRAVDQDGGHIVASVEVDGSLRELRAEKLLIATGRRANSAGIGLDRAGVRTGQEGAVVVNEYLQTSVPHIWAAGDVVGRSVGNQMATPVGSKDGGIAASNALASGAPRRVDHRVVPRAIFIDPPAAIVGMTEEEAVAAGHPCWCNAIPMSLVPRAGATRDTRGFVKMVADAQTNEVLGVTMLGAGAHEVIHEAAMALRFRATLHDFIDLLHVYPTMAEALKIVAISRFKNPAKLSCCAE
jgi:mercuric reductase